MRCATCGRVSFSGAWMGNGDSQQWQVNQRCLFWRRSLGCLLSVAGWVCLLVGQHKLLEGFDTKKETL